MTDTWTGYRLIGVQPRYDHVEGMTRCDIVPLVFAQDMGPLGYASIFAGMNECQRIGAHPYLSLRKAVDEAVAEALAVAQVYGAGEHHARFMEAMRERDAAMTASLHSEDPRDGSAIAYRRVTYRRGDRPYTGAGSLLVFPPDDAETMARATIDEVHLGSVTPRD